MVDTLKLIQTDFLGFGGASLSGEGGGYGFGELSESQAESLILGAFERGLRLFDTAPIYGFGLSEERLGRYAPKDAVILTKGGIDWHPNKRVNLTNEPEIIERMFHESRTRLKREVLDLYLIHWPDPRVDIRRPFEKLVELKQAGWVKRIGLSNTHEEDFKKALTVAPVDALQFEASFLERTQSEIAKTLTSIQSQNNPKQEIITTGWGTLAKGILTGRVHEKRKFDSADARSHAPWWKWPEVLEKIKKAQGFLGLASELRCSPAALAAFYSNESLGVDIPLVGFKSVQDLNLITEFRSLKDSDHKLELHKKLQKLSESL